MEHTIREIIKAIQLNMHIGTFVGYLWFSEGNNKNGLNSV